MIEWNQYWKRYSLSKAEKWLILQRNKIINAYLDKIALSEKQVIELGCGYGSNIRLLNKKRGDVRCYALDNSPVAVNLVRGEISDAIVADCRNTPFSRDSFDLVFSAGLMEHFQDETPFLKETKRILKKDGYLITFVPARFSLWKLYQLIHFGLWQHGYEKSYTYRNLNTLFINNGFLPVETIGIDPFSINGVVMKLFDITMPAIVEKSFLRSGYTELCIVCKRRL
jgi:SAM-dependent methyltransferase